MISKNIYFKNFKLNKDINKIKKDLKILLKENNEVIKSLGVSYKNSYDKKIILKLKRYSHIRIIGMGGSILGSQSIYDFLKKKIKKKFSFVNNLRANINFLDKKKYMLI